MNSSGGRAPGEAVNKSGLTWEAWWGEACVWAYRAAGCMLATIDKHTDPRDYWSSGYTPEDAAREMLLDAGYDPKETTDLIR
jgi:hypothetical protein